MNKLTSFTKQTIKSTELVEIINEFRKAEGNSTELQHYDFIKKIKKEIETLKNLGLKGEGNFSVAEYTDIQGKSRPCFELNRDGMFQMLNSESAYVRYKTIEYINKLEENLKQPQKQITSSEYKTKIADARLKNAKARTANIYLKIANNDVLSKEYRQVLLSYAAKELSDNEIIPLPVVKRKTYSATEIGEQLGISSNMVGKIANTNNLKNEKFGKFFHDKSRYSSKEVESFRYYENVIPVIRDILKGTKSN